ncbi:MAG: ribbon-helix-helix protein, CopG family [Bryobacteraceae bacterium]
MKTTVEIPDALYRQVKAAAARRGVSFREFLTEALRERLRPMRAFGGLRDLHRETKRVERSIEEAFERVDEEDWR